MIGHCPHQSDVGDMLDESRQNGWKPKPAPLEKLSVQVVWS
jgi:hypothetical protein